MTTTAIASASLDDVLTREFVDWAASGLARTTRPRWNRSGAEVETDAGRFIDFSANDYLGLATDPRLSAAAIACVETAGVGATASRLIAGTHPEHERLERDIADFFGVAASLSFSTGFAANVGTIPALVTAGDVIFADAYNHASLIDGCRLSRADVHVFAHRDMDALRELLVAHRSAARRALIVSDGLFSMDGDLADMPTLIALAREYSAWTYIDDAHAVGIVGGGRGSAQHFGVHGAVDVTVGTLGKAFGAAGAFVYGSEVLRRHLLNRARSFVYSTAMIPAQAAAGRAAVRIVAADAELRTRLRNNVVRLRQLLAARGASLRGEPESHIIPLVVGDPDETMRIEAAIRARGILVGAVRPPTVAHGGSRLRISVSAAHTERHIHALADAFTAVSAQ